MILAYSLNVLSWYSYLGSAEIAIRYSSVITISVLELRVNYNRLRYNDYFEVGNSYVKKVKRDLYSYRNLYCDKYI